MAVKKGNTRLIFTCTEKQAIYLKNLANQMDISVGELLRFFIRTSTSRFIKMLPEQDLERIYQIAKTPWLKDDDF